MQAGPLTLLGDAIAQAGRDYMHIKLTNDERDQQREEQLADRATMRSQQLTDVADARQYEQQQYRDRQKQGIITQLVVDGYLKPDDAADPEAIQAALERGGKEYVSTVRELEGYKAALPVLLSHVSVDGAGDIYNMKPNEIGKAREIMAKIANAEAEKTKTQTGREETGRKNAAMYGASLFAKTTAMESKMNALGSYIEAIQDGTYQPKPDEIASARAAAIAQDPTLIKVQNLPKLQAAIHEQLWGTPAHPEAGLLRQRAYAFQSDLKQKQYDYSSLLRSQANLDDLAKSGLFNSEEFTKLMSPQTPAALAPSVEAPAPARSGAGYVPPGGAPVTTGGTPRSLGIADAAAPSAVQTMAGVAQDAGMSFFDPVALKNTATNLTSGLGQLGTSAANFALKLAPSDVSDQQRAVEQEYNQLVQQPRTTENVNRMAYLRRIRDSYVPLDNRNINPSTTPATLSP